MNNRTNKNLAYMEILKLSRNNILNSAIGEHPLFIKLTSEERFTILLEEIDHSYFKDVISFFKKNSLPNIICSIYLIINNPVRDFTIFNYAFLSFKEIKERVETLAEMNQTYILDIAHKDLNNGNIQTMYLIRNTENIFFKKNNISSDDSRETTWNWILNCNEMDLRNIEKYVFGDFFDKEKSIFI